MRKNKIMALVSAFTLAAGCYASFSANKVMAQDPDPYYQYQSADDEYETVNQEQEDYCMVFHVYSDHAELDACPSYGAKKIVIPEEVNGVPVTYIDNVVFWHHSELEEIVIPDTITDVGWGAFKYTKWLENKRAEDTMVVINGILIDGSACSGDVVIPETVKTICDEAFSGADKLVSVTVPDTVENIGYEIFRNCRNLKKVIFPDNMNVLKTYTFAECEKLETLVLPAKLETVQCGAFMGCIGFKEIALPDTVTRIESEAFEFCEFETIKLPASLTYISDDAFRFCKNLKEIIVPETVKCVDENKLEQLYGLATNVAVETPYPSLSTTPGVAAPPSTPSPEANNCPTAKPSSTTESNYIHGDVNLDGVIDVSDLTDLALILVDKKIPDDAHFMYGDVDYDGESTLTDLAIIRQFLSKKIPSLPESKAVSYASYEARKKAREQAIKPDNPPTPSAVPSHEPTPSYSATPSPAPTGYFPLPSNAPGIMFGTDSIACKNTDQASEIISNYDTYNYSDNQKEFLAAMKSDGFLYAPDKMLDIAVTVNDECYLYATEVFGDINIEYCAKYRDFDYHVYICYADKELLKNSESEKNYLMEHCSFTGSKFMKIKGTNMYYTWAGIVFFIDENHYCYINTIDSRDNMLKFAENFSLKKISF